MIELAWAAGFFDGEGYIGCGVTRRNLCLAINQVDRRPLDRFAAAVGMPDRVMGPFVTARGDKVWQPQHKFTVANFERIQAVVAMLWKYLSGPKREQAAAALNQWNAYVRIKPGRKSKEQ